MLIGKWEGPQKTRSITVTYKGKIKARSVKWQNVRNLSEISVFKLCYNRSRVSALSYDIEDPPIGAPKP